MTFTKNATVIECGSEADALEDCSVRYRMNAACQYALVQCGLEEDPRDDSDQSPGKYSPDSKEPNNGEDENVNDDN